MQIEKSLSAEWTVLFGASGSGKSTLLRLIAGLWAPAGCIVTLHARDLSRVLPHRRGIGFVAQQPALFPHLPAGRNVAFGCRKQGDTGFVSELLREFELEPLVQKYPASLSGGEQQRVSIARALAMRPRMLLLDEAFTGMHRRQQERLAGIVRAYSRRLGMPVLSVTHDVAEAFLCADEVLRIEAGRIVARGTPQEVLAEERNALLQTLG